MDVRQTSLLAYAGVKLDGTERSQKERIYSFLKENPEGFTREEIRVQMGVMYTSVCARVRSLILEGKLIDGEEKKLNASGKMAYVVRAI